MEESLPSYDAIVRILLIGLIVAPNLLIIWYLFTNIYRRQAKFIEDEIEKWTSMLKAS